MAIHDLIDKNVIITGASRGLGAVIAKAMWEAGANLLLVARNQQALEQVVLECGSRPRQVAHILATDLSCPDAGEIILASARKSFRKLDVLVNNAAIQGPIGPAWENDWADWNRALAVNLLAPVDLSRRCAAWMIAEGQGKIICLSGGGRQLPAQIFLPMQLQRQVLCVFVRCWRMRCVLTISRLIVWLPERCRRPFWMRFSRQAQSAPVKKNMRVP